MLGRTGREVHRLGIASSFGLGAAGVEEAIERGVNYVYWGSLRRSAFGQGLRNVIARGGRDKICLVIQSYTRLGFLMGWSLRRALRWLGTDHADVLLLGWWQSEPPLRIIDAALALQQKGLARHIALSTHERPLLPKIAGGPYDVFHVRYNAAHRGAEAEVFDPLGSDCAERPGLVAFTALRWGSLVKTPAPDGRMVTAGDCYRFALSHPSVDVCMTGPRNDGDVRHALDALEKGPLSEEDMAWMRGHGDRIHG